MPSSPRPPTSAPQSWSQQGWKTQQQGDVDRLTAKAQDAALNVAQDNLKVQRAVVARLEELTSFERVVAPFDGVITARNVDVGDLVMADNAGGTSMFTMDRTDVLRIQVYVPQDSVFAIKDGFEAEITVPEIPGRVFQRQDRAERQFLAARYPHAFDRGGCRNPNGELQAGIYCRVHFDIPRLEPVIIVPSQAVIFNSNGLTAAVYENGVARIRHLDLLRDDGAQVEVRAGLNPGDRIILSPPIDIRDGMRVQTGEDGATKTASINTNAG